MKHCPSLCHLDLSFSGLRDVEIKTVFDALRYVPHLVSLNLGGCKLALTSMKYLCAKFCHTIQPASLSPDANLDIGGEGVKALAEGLHDLPKLESLSLRGINRQLSIVDESSKIVFISLGQAFVQCRRLSRLDLSANRLHQGKFVGTCIKGATKLMSLDLAGNAFQDQGIESLAKFLPHLTMLSELFLGGNYLTCSGLKSLSGNLKFLPNLRKLSLQSNLISDAGVSALANSLPNTPKLVALFLGYNSITEVGVGMMFHSFQCLTELQCLDLKGNLLSDAIILEVASNLVTLPKLRQLIIWSSVTDCPLGTEAETAKPVGIFSPNKRLSIGLSPKAIAACTNGITEEKHHNKCYVPLKEVTFRALMSAAHAHGSLQGIYLSETGIPKGTDVQAYPRLRLVGQYKNE